MKSGHKESHSRWAIFRVREFGVERYAEEISVTARLFLFAAGTAARLALYLVHVFWFFPWSRGRTHPARHLRCSLISLFNCHSLAQVHRGNSGCALGRLGNMVHQPHDYRQCATAVWNSTCTDDVGD